jgi:SAM-dependent methyltransferase
LLQEGDIEIRELVRQFVQICAEYFVFREPIYEFGCYQPQGQEGFADLRPFFPGKVYIGADLRKGPGVDIILYLHNIDLPSESVGSVLILDTLEHVEYPRKALRELQRILKPGGILIMSSVMDYPIHDSPSDYWRFTPAGFQSLLKDFGISIVGYAGNRDFPHTVVGFGLKGDLSNTAVNEFKQKLEEWSKGSLDGRKSHVRNLIKEFLPPVILRFYVKFRGLLY